MANMWFGLVLAVPLALGLSGEVLGKSTSTGSGQALAQVSGIFGTSPEETYEETTERAEEASEAWFEGLMEAAERSLEAKERAEEAREPSWWPWASAALAVDAGAAAGFSAE